MGDRNCCNCTAGARGRWSLSKVSYNSIHVGLAQTVYIRSIFVLFCAKISKYTGYIYVFGQPYTCMIHVSGGGIIAGAQIGLSMRPRLKINHNLVICHIYYVDRSSIGLVVNSSGSLSAGPCADVPLGEVVAHTHTHALTQAHTHTHTHVWSPCRRAGGSIGELWVP